MGKNKSKSEPDILEDASLVCDFFRTLYLQTTALFELVQFEGSFRMRRNRQRMKELTNELEGKLFPPPFPALKAIESSENLYPLGSAPIVVGCIRQISGLYLAHSVADFFIERLDYALSDNPLMSDGDMDYDDPGFYVRVRAFESFQHQHFHYLRSVVNKELTALGYMRDVVTDAMSRFSPEQKEIVRNALNRLGWDAKVDAIAEAARPIRRSTALQIIRDLKRERSGNEGT